MGLRELRGVRQAQARRVPGQELRCLAGRGSMTTRALSTLTVDHGHGDDHDHDHGHDATLRDASSRASGLRGGEAAGEARAPRRGRARARRRHLRAHRRGRGEAAWREDRRVAFHEVGADDSIADSSAPLRRWRTSRPRHGSLPPAVAPGVETARGPLPVPAPATLALLDRDSDRPGRRRRADHADGRRDPRRQRQQFRRAAALACRRGWLGRGQMSSPNRPNLLRAVVGERSARRTWLPRRRCCCWRRTSTT